MRMRAPRRSGAAQRLRASSPSPTLSIIITHNCVDACSMVDQQMVTDEATRQMVTDEATRLRYQQQWSNTSSRPLEQKHHLFQTSGTLPPFCTDGFSFWILRLFGCLLFSTLEFSELRIDIFRETPPANSTTLRAHPKIKNVAGRHCCHRAQHGG